jgi:hypothetical protein
MKRWFQGAPRVERTEHSRITALIRSLRARPAVAPLIRLGPKGDGGYLLPDDLEDIVACVSPGVSTEVGFDEAMASRGIDVFMADGSVEGPPIESPRFHFFKKHFDVVDDDAYVRLDTFCAGVPEGELVLQMDIEGAEWPVLLDATRATLERFRIMVVEFHDLEAMLGAFSFSLIEAVFRKLLQSHSVAHLHPNNGRALTVSEELAIPNLEQRSELPS